MSVKAMSDTRVPSVAGLMAQLGVMQNMKHIYTGILNMSEEAYQRMVKRQEEKLKKAQADSRYQPWP